MKQLLAIIIMAIAALTLVTSALGNEKPLKVYILVGQSNMQGTARDTVIPAMAEDPVTKHLYDLMIDENGKPRVRDEVKIAAFSQQRENTTTKQGDLTIGYGSDLRADNVFGPEWTFGFTLHEHLQEPFLIIKTAWGGKDLRIDFRPPSAGPLDLREDELTQAIERGRGTREELIAAREEATGRYYRLMAEHVKQVLADPGKYHPAYDPEQGYEIAGFVWFQGFNDMVSGRDPLYEATEDKPAYAAYSDLLAHFIRDVRQEFNTPKMPFVIGVIGTGGSSNADHPFRPAMAAPAALPEFQGNVVAVHTANYYDEKLGELVDRSWRWQRPAWDPQNKYGDLREKITPLHRQLEETKKIEDRAERTKQQRAIQQQMDAIMYTPEEAAYLAANRSNRGFHYDGSAKNFARFGEAFANAIIEMAK